MKNIEVVNNLNKLNRFINREVELNKPLVTTIAKWKMKKNLKLLSEIDKPYEECMQDIIKAYELQVAENGNISIPEAQKDNAEKISNELRELMQAENEVNLNMITEKDFTEDCLLGDMLLLDFMTKEGVENE